LILVSGDVCKSVCIQALACYLDSETILGVAPPRALPPLLTAAQMVSHLLAGISTGQHLRGERSFPSALALEAPIPVARSPALSFDRVTVDHCHLLSVLDAHERDAA
jgi:hypothetical protein